MRSVRLAYLLLLALLLPSTGLAATVEREVTGMGVTRDEAVYNGLEQAIQQVTGTSVKVDRSLSSSATEESRYGDQGESFETRTNAQQKNQIKAMTEGLIDGYEILSARQTADRRWLVDMRVKVLQYKTPGLDPSNRRTLAITGGSSSQARWQFGNESISGERLRIDLESMLEAEFTQSRRFAVLDRSSQDTYDLEKSILTSGDAAIDQQVRLGQVLGADYLVSIKIENAGASYRSKELISGETKQSTHAHLTVGYKIIVMATRQVKWSDRQSVTINAKHSIAPRTLVASLGESVARKITNAALGNIYPIRLVKVAQEQDRVVLNQGGMTLKPGQVLNVYRQGEVLKDPYTGESLGATESRVGQIEISRVEAKISYAQVISGRGELAVGDICRPKQSAAAGKKTEAPESTRPPAVKRDADGGVRLPFD